MSKCVGVGALQAAFMISVYNNFLHDSVARRVLHIHEEGRAPHGVEFLSDLRALRHMLEQRCLKDSTSFGFPHSPFCS